MKDKTFEKFLEFDRAVGNSPMVEYPLPRGTKIYNGQKIDQMQKKLGRKLTAKELKAFEVSIS